MDRYFNFFIFFKDEVCTLSSPRPTRLVDLNLASQNVNANGNREPEFPAKASTSPGQGKVKVPVQ